MALVDANVDRGCTWERAQHACNVSGISDGVLLVPRPSDVRWLCNFSGSNGQVLFDVTNGEMLLLTDGRYGEQAHDEASRQVGLDGKWHVAVVRTEAERSEQINRFVGDRILYVDPTQVSHSVFSTLTRDAGKVETCVNPLAEERRVKSVDEVARMERACDIADEALMSVLARGICGLTEQQVRIELDFAMLQFGAQDVSFETIVATGPNAAMPHHRPCDAVIEPGHLVVIDMGALVDGYHSDMTRTVRIGEVPEELSQMLVTVRESQAAGVDVVTHGVAARDVDEACRAPMRSVGLEDLFLHGTGHGVGLDIHEEPFLSPRSTTQLSAGEVVTVEPGLYRRGLGGCRIEDLVLVTASGRRILTKSPKDLSCPPSPRMT